jgi:hypothetical protein
MEKQSVSTGCFSVCVWKGDEPMLYRVYLWLLEESISADLVQEVHASSVDHALSLAMERHQLTYVPFAWIVSPEDSEVDAYREGVFLLTPEQVKDFISWETSVSPFGEVPYGA